MNYNFIKKKLKYNFSKFAACKKDRLGLTLEDFLEKSKSCIYSALWEEHLADYTHEFKPETGFYYEMMSNMVNTTVVNIIYSSQALTHSEHCWTPLRKVWIACVNCKYLTLPSGSKDQHFPD